MKYWYKAVCDEHKEMCDVLVHNTYRLIPVYLQDRDEDIVAWLMLHLSCKLRVLHLEGGQLDELFESGYTDIKLKENKETHG